jgi:deoxyribodipyrimidine photolyase
MASIGKAFGKAWVKKLENDWEKIYVLVDLHDTILEGQRTGRERWKWYPHALEALQKLSDRDDICLILWTSSHKKKLAKYLSKMALNGVKFDYVNSNPEVGATDILDPSEKLYFNVGIDDKFGFDPETDWKGVSLIADHLDNWEKSLR